MNLLSVNSIQINNITRKNNLVKRTWILNKNMNTPSGYCFSGNDPFPWKVSPGNVSFRGVIFWGMTYPGKIFLGHGTELFRTANLQNLEQLKNVKSCRDFLKKNLRNLDNFRNSKHSCKGSNTSRILWELENSFVESSESCSEAWTTGKFSKNFWKVRTIF